MYLPYDRDERIYRRASELVRSDEETTAAAAGALHAHHKSAQYFRLSCGLHSAATAAETKASSAHIIVYTII